MKTSRFVGILNSILILVLVACGPAGPAKHRLTFRTTEDLRWGSDPSMTTTETVPQLDCETLDDCKSKNLTPAKHTAGSVEVYVWSSTSRLTTETRLFFVEIVRPSKKTYDRIQLHIYDTQVDDLWYIGVPRGHQYNETQITVTSWPLAYGAKEEKWAVVFNPLGSGWEYSFVEDYWE